MSHDDFYDDHSPFRDEPRAEYEPEVYVIHLRCDHCDATASLTIRVGDEAPPRCPNGHGPMRTPSYSPSNSDPLGQQQPGATT